MRKRFSLSLSLSLSLVAPVYARNKKGVEYHQIIGLLVEGLVVVCVVSGGVFQSCFCSFFFSRGRKRFFCKKNSKLLFFPRRKKKHNIFSFFLLFFFCVSSVLSQSAKTFALFARFFPLSHKPATMRISASIVVVALAFVGAAAGEDFLLIFLFSSKRFCRVPCRRLTSLARGVFSPFFPDVLFAPLYHATSLSLTAQAIQRPVLPGELERGKRIGRGREMETEGEREKKKEAKPKPTT